MIGHLLPPRTRVEIGREAFWLTLLLVLLAQMADLITFRFTVQVFGASGELGPLGALYTVGGFWAVALVKLSMISLVIAILSRYPWRRFAVRRRMALIVASFGIFGALTNVMAFYWLV